MVSHMRVFATPYQLCIILNIWILTTKTILVLGACSRGSDVLEAVIRDVASGSVRHLDIGLQVVESSSLVSVLLLVRAVPPTNTNFRWTLLLTQDFRRLSMKTYLYRASNLKTTITGLSFIMEVNFWCPPKTVVFCDLFKIIIINFFRRVFSEYTEAVSTSLILIDAILPEICAFIVGFSCNVWTKMRSLLAH